MKKMLFMLIMSAMMWAPTVQAQPSGGDPPEFSCEDLTYLIGSYQGSIDHINEDIATATASRDYWVNETASRIARKVQLQTVEIPAAQAAYDAQVAYWEWCVSYHGHESQTTYDAMVLKGQLKRALDDLIEEMADLDGTQTNSESMAYAQHKVWIYNNILATHQSYMTHLLAQLALAQQMYEDQNCGGGGLLSVPPEAQPLAPVADPMFGSQPMPRPVWEPAMSPVSKSDCNCESKKTGVIKTALAAGAYLNSNRFTQSLMAMPSPAPVVFGDTPIILYNDTCHTLLIWGNGNITNPYYVVEPKTWTENFGQLALYGDMCDFVRICGVWYKTTATPYPLSTWEYRVSEQPCNSGHFVLERKYVMPTGGGLPATFWALQSPHPGPDFPENWDSPVGEPWYWPAEGDSCTPCPCPDGGSSGGGGATGEF
jgi:hypothetical protein